MSKLAKAFDSGRASEQIALHLVAKFVLQELQFGVGLDAFRQHRQAQSTSEAEHGADDGRGLIVAMDRLDERAVDLDLVERKRAQVRERRIAGAEIVHGDADAERLDLPQGGQRAVEVANQRGLGDLDLQTTRRQAGLQQDLVQLLHEVGVVELDGRDIDGDRQRPRPGRGVAAGCLHDPVPDLQDCAGLFGNRDEDGGRNLAACRVLPAQQGLEAGRGLALDILLRLIGQPQFVARDRKTQIMFEQPAFANLGAHAGLEEAIGVAALGLGAVAARCRRG